jgi:hypothetical protein
MSWHGVHEGYVAQQGIGNGEAWCWIQCNDGHVGLKTLSGEMEKL